MFLCQNMNEKHQYGVDTLKNIPSCTSWIRRKYQSLFINHKDWSQGEDDPLAKFLLAMLWFVWSTCVWTTESDPAKNMGKCVVCQWRASDMVGQWGREGEGDSYSRLLREIQNLLHELWKFLHSLLSQIFIGKLLLKMGKLWIFESCETPVAWLGTTQPRAVPVAEPVFFRGTRRLAPFSGKDFSTSRPLLHY